MNLQIGVTTRKSMTIYHAAAYTHLPDQTHCRIPHMYVANTIRIHHQTGYSRSST